MKKLFISLLSYVIVVTASAGAMVMLTSDNLNLTFDNAISYSILIFIIRMFIKIYDDVTDRLYDRA